MGEENKTILEEDPSDPSDPRRRKTPSEEAQSSIPSCREDASNAWRSAPSHVLEEMRAMRKGTIPSYVGDLRRRRAPSHVVERMRAMQ